VRWRRIPKDRSAQPSNGTYKDWKVLLAQEGFHQCVYCAISETSFGGTRNFHVEHFRPKAIFVALENAFANLFYACSICNGFKGDDWRDPCDALETACYVSPASWEYADLLRADASDHLAVSDHVAGRFMIERLYLNRPQLIMERRLSAADIRLREIDRELTELSLLVRRRPRAKAKYVLLLEAFRRIALALAAARAGIPYEEADIRREEPSG
jgi:hypothetical protein